MIYNKHFNPRAPQGARQPRHFGIQLYRHFNPRAPQRARPEFDSDGQCYQRFQSTRSAGSATGRNHRAVRPQGISIHALRRERDAPRIDGLIVYNISIHALRRERDLPTFLRTWGRFHFNPRAPQGARPAVCLPAGWMGYFNPRAPQGARRRLDNTV